MRRRTAVFPVQGDGAQQFKLRFLRRRAAPPRRMRPVAEPGKGKKPGGEGRLVWLDCL